MTGSGPSRIRRAAFVALGLVAGSGCAALTGADDLYIRGDEAGATLADGGRDRDPDRDEGPGEDRDGTGRFDGSPVPPTPPSDAGGKTDGAVDGGVSRVFVLGRSVDGDLNGLGNADELCEEAARLGDLEGTFVAWLSSSVRAARERIPGEGPFVLLDGTPVSTSRSALLQGQLEHAIDLDEERRRVAEGTLVWTGTRTDGTSSGISDTCAEWNATMPQVTYGRTGTLGATDGGWTYGARTICATSARLYCFEIRGTRGDDFKNP